MEVDDERGGCFGLGFVVGSSSEEGIVEMEDERGERGRDLKMFVVAGEKLRWCFPVRFRFCVSAFERYEFRDKF